MSHLEDLDMENLAALLPEWWHIFEKAKADYELYREDDGEARWRMTVTWDVPFALGQMIRKKEA